MNRHERRKEAAKGVTVYCKTCREVIVTVRGRTGESLMADPAVKAKFDAHRAESGCPEVPIEPITAEGSE